MRDMKKSLLSFAVLVFLLGCGKKPTAGGVEGTPPASQSDSRSLHRLVESLPKAQPKANKAETATPVQAAKPRDWETPTQLARYMAQKLERENHDTITLRSNIASALVEAGDKKQALATLKNALEVAQKIQDEYEKADALKVTLNDLVEKINDLSGIVSATVFNDGSAFNAHRLSLISSKSGLSGGLIIDDGGLGFQFDTIVEAQDALLLVGDSPETGFLVPSKNNIYENVITGLDVTLLQSDTDIAEVTVSQEFSKIEKGIQSFVDSYNAFATSASNLSKYDPVTERRGVLQGKGIVFRIQNRLNSLINNRGPASTGTINSLVELGVQFDGFGKLKFDETRLAKQLAKNPRAVADFFLTDEDGFADRAEALMESLTDPLTGTISLEQNSIQASSDALIQRIAQLDELLEQKRERLLRQFINMESIISTLTSQQEALSLISPLQIIPSRR